MVEGITETRDINATYVTDRSNPEKIRPVRRMRLPPVWIRLKIKQ